MARTILYTFGFLLALLCALVTVSAVTALPVITVTQGSSVTVSVDLGFGTDADANELTVSVPEIGYYRNTAILNTASPVLADTFRVTAAPGNYAMSVRVGRNGETLRFTQYTLTVLPAGTVPANTSISTVTIPAGEDMSGIRIDPIPDMTAGESFILPVTITGDGEYTVEIPNLGFASYELPNPVTVHGELTVPVLIQIKNDLAPGTYAIPITVAGKTATARIRVIAYHEQNTMWFILVGVLLVVMAVILLLQRMPLSRAPPRDAPKPPQDDEKLITYY